MAKGTSNLRLLAWFARPFGRAVARTFELIFSPNNLIGENTLFMNFGYWEERTQSLDVAAQQLTELLGSAARLGPNDTVLDVGFGYGEQDLLWCEQLGVQRIIGINITPLQVELARQRVQERGLGDRVDLRLGSATEIDLPAGCVDKVVALESAMHFDTRERFFRDAFRVLRRGGRLATTDIVQLPGRRVPWFVRAYWHVPPENWYDRDGYAERLRATGFTNVEVRSIRDHVFPPFSRYFARRLFDPELRRRQNPLLNALYRLMPAKSGEYPALDYLLVTAEKP